MKYTNPLKARASAIQTAAHPSASGMLTARAFPVEGTQIEQDRREDEDEKADPDKSGRCHHPLKGWSLRQSRGGSPSRFLKPRGNPTVVVTKTSTISATTNIGNAEPASGSARKIQARPKVHAVQRPGRSPAPHRRLAASPARPRARSRAVVGSGITCPFTRTLILAVY